MSNEALLEPLSDDARKALTNNGLPEKEGPFFNHDEEQIEKEH